MPDSVPVSSVLISPRFLQMVGAPEHTKCLTFKIEAGDRLLCKADYFTGFMDEVGEKEWEVQLPRSSGFYKLLTGDLA